MQRQHSPHAHPHTLMRSMLAHVFMVSPHLSVSINNGGHVSYALLICVSGSRLGVSVGGLLSPVSVVFMN